MTQGDPGALRVPTSVSGVAGGVGTTTVSRVLGDLAHDLGTALPEWQGTPLLLVTRGTAAGTLVATEAVAALTSTAQSVRVVLAVVDDGPYRQPGTARSRLRALSPRLVGQVRLPYVEGWRYVDDPLTEPLPRAYARGVRSLSRLLNLS
jgi:hypothetical protein